MPTPAPLSPAPASFTLSHLAPRAVAALLLAALGGHAAAREGAPGWLAVAAAAGAGALLLHALWSLHWRLRAVVHQSTTALHGLGHGDTGFRLDAHGVADFDPLLLAIHDLREAVEPGLEGPRRTARPATAGVALEGTAAPVPSPAVRVQRA